METGFRNRKGRVKILALLSASFILGSAWNSSAEQPIVDYIRETALPPSGAPPGTQLDGPLSIDVTIPIVNTTAGTRTQIALKKGQTYRLETRGVYSWYSGFLADAECSQYLDPLWVKDRFRAAALPFLITNNGADPRAATKWDPNGDPFDVYINGKAFDWQPLTDTGGGCNARDHAYQISYTPAEDGFLRLQTYEPLLDNRGACVPSGTSCLNKAASFAVTIHQVQETSTQMDVLVESVVVDPRNLKVPPNVSTVNDLVAGEDYRFVASGTYNMYLYSGFEGDAECTISAGVENQTWEAHRYDAPPGSPYEKYQMGFDNGDLTVNNVQVQWLPTTQVAGTPKDCNPADHTYTYDFTPASTGKVIFRLLAAHHFMNRGLITVDIYRYPNLPTDSLKQDPKETVKEAGIEMPSGIPGAGTTRSPSDAATACDTSGAQISLTSAGCFFTVNPQNPSGTSVGLRAGSPYRIEVSGTYYWLNNNSSAGADAECTQGMTPNETVWLENRWGVAGAPFAYTNSGNMSAMTGWDGTGDPFDLYVNKVAVDWQPLTDTGGGCNAENHTYQTTLHPGSTGPVNFKIYNPMNGVPSGHLLTVKIFPGVELEVGPNDALLSSLVVSPKYDTLNSTQVNLTKGWAYRIVVSGTYTNSYYSGLQADAECTSTTQAPLWERNRYGISPDGFDLYFNGAPVDWSPLTDTGKQCNAKDHTYRYLFTPSKTAPAAFRLKMPYHSANEGMIVVKIYLVDGAKV